MKRLLSMLYLAACALTALAADGVTLGFCKGQVSRTSTVSVDGAATVEAAILLPADVLKPYVGGQVTTVRVGLAARTNIDNVRAWLRTSLTGDNLSSADITPEGEPAIVRGWNDIVLDKPYTIVDGEALYVGFTYTQRAASSALSVVSGSQDGAFFFKGGADAEWQDRSSEGLLSVEAVVTADDLVGFDLQLLSATARYNAAGQIELSALVHNSGSQTVQGYTLTAAVPATGETIDTHISQPLANGASTTHALTLSPQSEGVGKQRALTLNISQLDGGVADERPDNNAQKVVFTYQRNVLLEEFTGEACTTCPRAALFLHDVLSQGDYAGRTVMMAHHAGYRRDFLTFLPADEDYEWFYNSTSMVYAPALMFDRVAEAYDYGEGEYFTPTVSPDSKAVIEDHLATALQRPASAYVDIEASVTPAGLIRIDVEGSRSTVFSRQPARLTVCLVEDHIAPRQQVSLSQWPEFEHTGALRAINATWGDVVEWTADDQFSATYTFTPDSEWVVGNMRALAFLSDYDATDPTKCEVENAAQVSLSGLTAIGSLTQPQAAVVAEQLYSADGRRLQAPVRGIVLKRQRLADGTTRIVKSIQ